MVPFIQREPAAVSAAVIAVLNLLQILGVVSLTADAVSALNIALVAVLGLFVRQNSTSTASPTLARGSEVTVQGTSDTVIVQPSPPGPVGIEGGAS
ncbi:MAG: hypothetical protein ABIU97_08990 [Dehalococcoidia bacterium]